MPNRMETDELSALPPIVICERLVSPPPMKLFGVDRLACGLVPCVNAINGRGQDRLRTVRRVIGRAPIVIGEQTDDVSLSTHAVRWIQQQVVHWPTGEHVRCASEPV